MQHNKNLLFGFKTEKSFLFKKKILVLFLFGCMCVNGFIPSSVEISRYSFVMIMATATQNAAAKVFSKCNDSLMTISNKLCKEFYAFVFSASVDAAAAAASKEAGGGKKDNTSNNHTIIIERTTLNESRKIASVMNDSYYSEFLFAEKLFKLFMNYKIPDAYAGAGIFILFLIFIFAVIQRKGMSEAELLNTIINNGKTRISA